MACFIWRFNWMPNWKILTSISFSASSSSDGKGPYMSLVDLQKKTILTRSRLKMIYKKKILQKCLNTGGILSDTGKVWSTSVEQPTVICSPFSIQRETWSWSSWDYQWLPTQRFKFEVAEMNLHSILISSKSMYTPPSQHIVIDMFCTRFGQCEVNVDSLSKL